ncbi:MAG TPA: protease inhibitor I42 family protein [Nitrososphaeraceae archaeon]|nr:protease inhibitor I42 family protein [Nitrososphaeraceae archaeon]
MKKDEQKTISVKLGSNFEIKRESNPSTGYNWSIQYDKSFLELLSQTYEPEPSDIILGSGGYEKFCFKTLKSGNTNIKMAYKRKLEDSSDFVTFLIQIN